jgi:hypothetical protein
LADLDGDSMAPPRNSDVSRRECTKTRTGGAIGELLDGTGAGG